MHHIGSASSAVHPADLLVLVKLHSGILIELRSRSGVTYRGYYAIGDRLTGCCGGPDEVGIKINIQNLKQNVFDLTVM